MCVCVCVCVCVCFDHRRRRQFFVGGISPFRRRQQIFFSLLKPQNISVFCCFAKLFLTPPPWGVLQNSLVRHYTYPCVIGYVAMSEPQRVRPPPWVRGGVLTLASYGPGSKKKLIPYIILDSFRRRREKFFDPLLAFVSIRASNTRYAPWSSHH